MSRSGAAAATYGVSLEKLIGDTTAIGEVTRESGAVIGNALKSIYSRLYSDGSISALEAVGVAVKDVNGENREASVILDDLGKVWQNLTMTQKEQTGVTVAGRYQLTR